MSSTASVQVQQIKGAILVPSRAVQTQAGNSSVTVLNGQVPVVVRVTTGVTNNGQTVVVDCTDTGAQCLKPNDTLVLPATTTRTTTQTNRGFGGGGAPGGLPFGGGR
jgi:macrolide-specific efflux system membrane fusion protein